MPFQNKVISVLTGDGRNFALLEDVFYTANDGTEYAFPKGAQSDGISSPPEAWPLRPPFGQDWLAGVGHDCFYRNTALKVLPDGSRVKADLNKEQSDLLLREMAVSLGDNDFQADQLYYGVKDFGWRAWSTDRD